MATYFDSECSEPPGDRSRQCGRRTRERRRNLAGIAFVALLGFAGTGGCLQGAGYIAAADNGPDAGRDASADLPRDPGSDFGSDDSWNRDTADGTTPLDDGPDGAGSGDLAPGDTSDLPSADIGDLPPADIGTHGPVFLRIALPVAFSGVSTGPGGLRLRALGPMFPGGTPAPSFVVAQ